MKRFLLTAYLAISFLLIGAITALHAEEVLIFPQVIMSEGTICDTPEQVAQLLQNADEGKFEVVEGCGNLMVPVPVSVHRVGWYEREYTRVPLLKATHLISGEVQYVAGQEEKREGPQGT
jgi:hypothetical protein